MWYFVIYHFLIGEGRMIDLGFVYMSAPIASLFLVFPITFFTGFWLNRNVAFRARRSARARNCCAMRCRSPERSCSTIYA